VAITDRNLQPGTKLVARYHKQRFCCEVVAGEDGKLHYRLEDGREYKSPSAAGMAVTGKSCNGWAFWSVETAEPAPTSGDQQIENPESQTAGTGNQVPGDAIIKQTPSPGKKRIFRLPNQKGVPQGQSRWYCHDCAESFLTSEGETPRICPRGHRAV
jgi:hypothetical protein